jgi:hypothetical protein
MQAAWRAHGYHVAIASGQQFIEAGVTLHAELGAGSLQSGFVRVTHSDKFGPVDVLSNGVEVTVRDSPASHDRKTNLAVRDAIRRAIIHAGLHSVGARSGCMVYSATRDFSAAIIGNSRKK